MILAGAIGAAAVVSAHRLHELPALVAAFGLLLLVTALAGGWPSLLPWSVVLHGSAYLISLELRADDGSIDAAAPLMGAGLLTVTELAYWSLELKGPSREERRLLARRAAAVVALALVSLLLGAIVVTITAVPLGGGVLWDAIGVAAAAAALALILRLARRDVTPS